MKKFVITGFLITLFGCKTENKLAMNKEKLFFDYEGHRGCRGLMPENTIPAMLHALTLNIVTLEMDLHITKDSQVILSHDPWFNPDITTKPDGSFIAAGDISYVLYDMTYANIKKFDVGLKPYIKFPEQKKIAAIKPLLTELIDSVTNYCVSHKRHVSYNIEIKSFKKGDGIYHPKPKEYVDMVMKIVLQKKIENNVVIQSFDIRSLQHVHTQYPGIKTSLLIEATNTMSIDELVNLLGFVPTILSPDYSLVTSELVDVCHQKKIKVIPWTVNTLTEMQRLKSLHIDGLISDYPNLYSSIK